MPPVDFEKFQLSNNRVATVFPHNKPKVPEELTMYEDQYNELFHKEFNKALAASTAKVKALWALSDEEIDEEWDTTFEDTSHLKEVEFLLQSKEVALFRIKQQARQAA